MKKIDQLKAILDSQEGSLSDWSAILTDIRRGLDEEDYLCLICEQQQVGFRFDKTGEKLLGMYNWK